MRVKRARDFNLKKIAIIGGFCPVATIDYYRIIIKSYREKISVGYPEIIIYSMDLDKFLKMAKARDRNKMKDKIINWMLKAVNSLHREGADFALIASNTPHIVFDEVEGKSPIPMISIVVETAKVVEEKGLHKVGLFGTKITMQSDFYPKVFSQKGIKIVVPNEVEQNYINYKLFDELRFGRIVEETQKGFFAIAKRMIVEDGIEGIILGCTEIPLMLSEDEYFDIPFLNTSKIHAKSALEYCLGKE